MEKKLGGKNTERKSQVKKIMLLKNRRQNLRVETGIHSMMKLPRDRARGQILRTFENRKRSDRTIQR